MIPDRTGPSASRGERPRRRGLRNGDPQATTKTFFSRAGGSKTLSVCVGTTASRRRGRRRPLPSPALAADGAPEISRLRPRLPVLLPAMFFPPQCSHWRGRRNAEDASDPAAAAPSPCGPPAPASFSCAVVDRRLFRRPTRPPSCSLHDGGGAAPATRPAGFGETTRPRRGWSGAGPAGAGGVRILNRRMGRLRLRRRLSRGEARPSPARARSEPCFVGRPARPRCGGEEAHRQRRSLRNSRRSGARGRRANKRGAQPAAREQDRAAWELSCRQEKGG
jgi:hypothetical protein